MNQRTNPLRVALIQCDIIADNPEANIDRISSWVKQSAGRVDALILPETITTGFAPEASACAEAWEQGSFVCKMQELSDRYDLAIMGSALVKDDGKVSNRFFLFAPSCHVQWQDKRHLFSLGGEADMVVAAPERKILSYKGWRILPLICYDLRFPVWSRNVANEYDLIVCVANWPKARREVWKTLLKARAMENLSYVIGVNRIGKDTMGLHYVGDSALISPRGETISQNHTEHEEVIIGSLDYLPLEELRHKFPVWQDADSFEIRI